VAVPVISELLIEFIVFIVSSSGRSSGCMSVRMSMMCDRSERSAGRSR
jgi:hypothetical protein